MIQLPEVIDERTDMVKLFGAPKPHYCVDCTDLKRINSVGIRSLKTALARLKIDGSRFTFRRISPVLVEALDFVSNLFPEGTALESVQLPYLCPECNTAFVVLHPLNEVEQQSAALELAPCAKCGKDAEFDHIPEIFFGALLRHVAKS